MFFIKILKYINKKLINILINIIKYNSFTITINLRSFLYKILFSKAGKNVRICDAVTIICPENISIGNNVSIHEYSLLGAHGKLFVGSDVSIGSHFIVITADHIYNDLKISHKKQGLKYGKVEIGNNVWIGSRVTILNNIRISNNTIIGAGSVVTKNFPENTIIAGNPAKVIKNII